MHPCQTVGDDSTVCRLCSLDSWASRWFLATFCHKVCRHSSDPNLGKQLASGYNDLSISLKLVAEYQSHTYFKYFEFKYRLLRHTNKATLPCKAYNGNFRNLSWPKNASLWNTSFLWRDGWCGGMSWLSCKKQNIQWPSFICGFTLYSFVFWSQPRSYSSKLNNSRNKQLESFDLGAVSNIVTKSPPFLVNVNVWLPRTSLLGTLPSYLSPGCCWNHQMFTVPQCFLLV